MEQENNGQDQADEIHALMNMMHNDEMRDLPAFEQIDHLNLDALNARIILNENALNAPIRQARLNELDNALNAPIRRQVELNQVDLEILMENHAEQNANHMHDVQAPIDIIFAGINDEGFNEM